MIQEIEPLDVTLIQKDVPPTTLDAMKRTISSMLGLLPSDRFQVSIDALWEPLSKLLVSSMMTGYVHLQPHFQSFMYLTLCFWLGKLICYAIWDFGSCEVLGIHVYFLTKSCSLTLDVFILETDFGLIDSQIIGCFHTLCAVRYFKVFSFSSFLFFFYQSWLLCLRMVFFFSLFNLEL